MGCNAWNHSPSCNCGWGGDTGAGDSAGAVNTDSYKRSDDSCCYLTNCPWCGQKVYFIRHNGGSVWINPPLGWPWDPHGCMDQRCTSPANVQATSVAEFLPAIDTSKETITIGIVREVISTNTRLYSIAKLEFGSDSDINLLIRGSAITIVGAMVLYDSMRQIIVRPDDERYTIKVISRIGADLNRAIDLQERTKCLECNAQVSPKNFLRHLRKIHSFPRRAA
jgi:hypothetical protein